MTTTPHEVTNMDIQLIAERVYHRATGEYPPGMDAPAASYYGRPHDERRQLFDAWLGVHGQIVRCAVFKTVEHFGGTP